MFRSFINCKMLHQQPILSDAILWKAERIKLIFFYSTAMIFYHATVRCGVCSECDHSEYREMKVFTTYHNRRCSEIVKLRLRELVCQFMSVVECAFAMHINVISHSVTLISVSLVLFAYLLCVLWCMCI